MGKACPALTHVNLFSGELRLPGPFEVLMLCDAGVCTVSFPLPCSQHRGHAPAARVQPTAPWDASRPGARGTTRCDRATSGGIIVGGGVSSAFREPGKDSQRTRFSWAKKEEGRHSLVGRGEVAKETASSESSHRESPAVKCPRQGHGAGPGADTTPAGERRRSRFG